MWDQKERPWKGIFTITDPTDRHLFFCSTTVSIGDGRSTAFWEARWLNGISPKEIAPNLYNLARYKRRKVSTEMQSSNRIKNLTGINSQALIQEYILLYLALSTVQLTDHSDEIKWNWTMSGKYIVSSTYECQFQGSIGTFPATHIWKAMAEPKCNFFAWLAMHAKSLQQVI
jgi:hypothetical protein